MVVVCGGKILKNPHHFDLEEGNHLILANFDAKKQMTRNYISIPEGYMEMYDVPTVSKYWFLDSLASNSPQPVNEYILTGHLEASISHLYTAEECVQSII